MCGQLKCQFLLQEPGMLFMLHWSSAIVLPVVVHTTDTPATNMKQYVRERIMGSGVPGSRKDRL